MDRRDFLKLSGLAAASLLVPCTGTTELFLPPPVPIADPGVTYFGPEPYIHWSKAMAEAIYQKIDSDILALYSQGRTSVR